MVGQVCGRYGFAPPLGRWGISCLLPVRVMTSSENLASGRPPVYRRARAYCLEYVSICAWGSYRAWSACSRACKLDMGVMSSSEILASGWPPVYRSARAYRLEYAAFGAWELTAPGVRSQTRACVFAWQGRFMLVSLLLARERA